MDVVMIATFFVFRFILISILAAAILVALAWIYPPDWPDDF